MKECFKCGEEQPLSEFYKHKQMGDGHLNKCKECTKKDVTEHRWKNIERIRAYDRDRGSRQDASYGPEYRKRYPNKYKAKTMVSNAIRDKKLFRESNCSICNSESNIEGHHDDYLKPLNVRWLCSCCHKQWHRDNGEGLNGS